jgi:hypothetical protein
VAAAVLLLFASFSHGQFREAANAPLSMAKVAAA